MAREQTLNENLDEELRDLLITISVIAKRLANKLEANSQQTEDPLDFGGKDNEEKRTVNDPERRRRDIF